MREIAPGATVASFYGATETQRAIGYFIIPDSLPNARDQARVVPIGRGAPGVQLLLLTQNHQLAGIGETGELYIRSPHLAAGYVGDREHSRSKFHHESVYRRSMRSVIPNARAWPILRRMAMSSGSVETIAAPVSAVFASS